MMRGPAVGRTVADVALTGASDVVDTTDLGLDRFDASGRSRLAAGSPPTRSRSPFPKRPLEVIQNGRLFQPIPHSMRTAVRRSR